MLERRDVEAFLDGIAAGGQPSLLDLDPVDGRTMTESVKELIELPGREVKQQDLVIPARDGSMMSARLYEPDTPSAGPLVVYFHGGGWVVGSVRTHDALCSEICHATQLRVVSVEYRLAPENPFPAPLEDALDAVRWISDQQSLGGQPLHQIVLAGDSAGGGLAAVAARELRTSLPVDIVAQWLIYPALDIFTTYPSHVDHAHRYGWSDEALQQYYRYYLGSRDVEALKTDPRVSPVFSEDWRGLPPALIFTGSLDPLRDQGRTYAAKLVEHGVPTFLYEAEEQVHGAMTMRKILPSAQQDLLKLVEAFKALLLLSDAKSGALNEAVPSR